MNESSKGTVRSAPPPLQATDPPSLTSTRVSTVVSSAMQSAVTSKRKNRTGEMSSTTRTGGKMGTTMNVMVGILLVCVLMSAIVNIIHVHRTPVLSGSDTALSEALDQFVHTSHQEPSRTLEDRLGRKDDDSEEKSREGEDDNEDRGNESSGEAGDVDYDNIGRPHYDTLDCSTFGGPTKEIAQEMVYWQDIPVDSLYVSPFKVRSKLAGREQYLTFEPGMCCSLDII